MLDSTSSKFNTFNVNDNIKLINDRVVVYDQIYGFGDSHVYLDYKAKITSVHPNEISTEGADITIYGYGFYSKLVSNTDTKTTIKVT